MNLFHLLAFVGGILIQGSQSVSVTGTLVSSPPTAQYLSIDTVPARLIDGPERQAELIVSIGEEPTAENKKESNSLILRNSGTRTLTIPTSMNGSETFRQCMNQVIAEASIGVTNKGPLLVLYGCAGIKDSVITLAPKSTLHLTEVHISRSNTSKLTYSLGESVYSEVNGKLHEKSKNLVFVPIQSMNK